MASLFAKATSMVSGFLNDSTKLEPIIASCFSKFDKDGSGFVEGPELKACATEVCTKLGLTSLPVDKLDLVFNKVAGPDNKVDKTEFGQLVHQLLKAVHAEGGAAPAAAAAAPAQ